MRTLMNGLVAAMSIALLSPSAARAGGTPQKHDGLYLHVDLGLGALAAQSKDAAGTKTEASGGGAGLSLAIGGAVIENFVVAGRLWGTSVSDPTLKVGGQKLEGAKGSLGLSGVGVDLTYYFMPINIFVTLTPSISSVSTETKYQGTTTKETSKNGFALRVAAGKEWWVSDNWGIGLELEYAGSSNKSKATATDPSETISSGYLGMAFSATYN